MENLEKKGCVYFFKHSGLSPIKIGFSNSASPMDRFECFKTYAPYGAVLVGFIISENALELERTLHSRFSACRIKGEWFEIKDSDILDCIEFYSQPEFVNEKNAFEIAWAKRIRDLTPITIDEDFIFFSELSIKQTKEYPNKIVLNMSEIYNLFEGKLSKWQIKNILKNKKITPTAVRMNGIMKKGIRFFVK